MLKYAYDGVIVKVEDNGYIPEEEAMAYVDRARELHGTKVKEIIVKIDKDDPDMEWTKATVDRRLMQIVGSDNFAPWDERYGGKDG